jgi:hypothetical protein
MIISSQIIEIHDARDNKRKIVYQHTTDEGKILGPFVEHRPEEEDPETFANQKADALNNEELIDEENS